MGTRLTSLLAGVGARAGIATAVGVAVMVFATAGCGRAKQSVGSIEGTTMDGSVGIGQGNPPDGAIDGATNSPGPLVPEWNCGPTCYRAPEIPATPNPVIRFGGTADLSVANRPVIVYPLAGALYPVNLADITFQWRRAAVGTQHLFRIRVTGSSGSGDIHFDFFVPCKQTPSSIVPEECAYALPPGAWLETIGRNRGQRMDIAVAAVDSTPGKENQVATSDELRLNVSPDSLVGGLYYWSTKLRGTYRLLFGGRKAQPFISPNSSVNPTDCGGCHSVSLNGNVIAFTAGADEGALVATAAADPTKPFFKTSETPDSSTIALNPDGTRALVVFQSRLVLHDTSDGQVLATVDPALLGPDRAAYHPDWAPDGKSIAVTLSLKADNDYTVRDGSIGVITYEAGAFGAARVVAPESAVDFNYYPTWSPDGKWIAFASAHIGPGVTSYSQWGSRLRLVARDGGRIYELAKATHLADHSSTWPKFAPYTQSNDNILFITFSSKIDYGFLLKNSAAPNDAAKRPQLWLTAIDVRDLPTGDPSKPPIWLPFQEVTQSNHLGYWTQRLGCPIAGQSTGCAEDELCDKDGYCKRPIP
jgi:hypothetical protein